MHRYAVVLVWWCASCAVTAKTCPTNTKLMTAREADGRAQWCASTESTIKELPTAGRSFAGTIGLGQPTAMPGGVEGPFTSWYASGGLHSHGGYVNFGARSVPDGLWAFWHPNGERWVIGSYHRGVAVGCFVEWDESGKRSTGTVEGDQLHVEPCTPPDDDEVLEVEGRRTRPADDAPPWADVSLQGFAAPDQEFGVRNNTQIDPDPGMSLAFGATARVRFGRLRIGPTFGVRIADATGILGLTGGLSVGWELPRFHPRIDTEVAIELGAQRLDVTAGRNASARPPSGGASVAFWLPLPAAQAGIAFALSPNIDAIAALRMDGMPARNATRDVVYCDFGFGCAAPVRETWSIGGFAYGATLGLRLLLR